MKKINTFLLFILMSLFGFAQQQVTLTFTGRDVNNSYVQLNRVEIANLTQGWQETIYYPDTILVMSSTGIEDYGKMDNFSLSQNYPNPFDGVSDFSLCLPKEGQVSMDVYDLNGKKITSYNNTLSAGCHVFRVLLSTAQSYFLTARSGNDKASIKMVNTGNSGSNAIHYVGDANRQPITVELSNTKGQSQHSFTPGDQMKYVGYATIYGQEVESQTIILTQYSSEEIRLQFDVAPLDGQPCSGASTLTDVDGNVYNTVQIGQQCWMRENLRTTKYADNTTIPMGSTPSYDVANRYCPNNDTNNVSTYGYLYNWLAVMHNSSSSSSNPSGAQGICPNGWHVPSDAEWTQLTDYVSSQNQYVCGSYSNYIAKALASTTGWDSSTEDCAVGNNPSTNNATGFSALPAGYYSGSYFNFGGTAYFWGATQGVVSDAYYRDLLYNDAHVYRNDYGIKFHGFSVRCLKDDGRPVVTTAAVTNITTSSATCGGSVIDDGGFNVTARGVCWSTSQNPTISDSHTTDGTGTGSYTSNLTGLTVGATYYVRAYATNSMGTAYGDQIYFVVSNPNDGQPCSTAATLTDVDGNVYNTVQIGQQCWMKENLRTTKYADGTNISLGSSTSTDIAYRYYPNNDTNNVSTYGYLYNWPAVMNNSSSSSSNPSGVQGICPDGWHVPSDDEWTQLEIYVSSQSQYVCGSDNNYIAKALASTTGWNSSENTCTVGNNPSTNNATGFSAVPAGFYYGGYNLFGNYADFWSATQYDASGAYGRTLGYGGAGVSGTIYNEYNGFSVRCLKD